jgi:hypothetical protein
MRTLSVSTLFVNGLAVIQAAAEETKPLTPVEAGGCMDNARLTHREFQKLCSVYRSLSDEERGSKQSLVERLAMDAPSLAAKMAELTDGISAGCSNNTHAGS